jgi:hypothetical protein
MFFPAFEHEMRAKMIEFFWSNACRRVKERT